MKIKQHILMVTLLALLFGASCNVVKYLKPGEELYTGAKIKVNSVDKVDKKQISRELEKVLRPKPNQTILGIRFKLWFYYVAGENPKKGFKKMLKNKLGEKPVFFNPQTPELVSEIMVNRLNSLGYFDAALRYKVLTKNQKVSVQYTATVSKPYTIKEVIFPNDSDLVNQKINETKNETILKPGDQYNLDALKIERLRIDAFMKDEGFYYFNADYLMFKADSTSGDKSVRLRMLLKDDAPQNAKTRYYINNIYINPAFRNNPDTTKKQADTLRIDGYHYLAKDSTFKPRAVVSSIFIKSDELYSRKAYSLSIRRLMGMGVFRYVNIRYEDTLLNKRGMLDVFINMTPTYRRSLQLELDAVTKSNNYSGPALTLSLKDRNLFRGAELWLFNVNSNFETQFTGIQKGFNSYEIGVNTQLYLPKFLAPITIRNVSSLFVPRTKFDLGFRTLNRVLYFSMNAVNFSYGYTWKETQQKEHTFNPIAINFARLEKTTRIFDELLAANPYLQKSFEEQFTIGGNYSFTYNSLVGTNKRHQYYFNGIVDVSGNLLNLFQNVITGRRSTDANPHTLFTYRYSQYTKLSTDARYYYVINKNSKIASRLIMGAGLPYGNSTTMPYVKQFFSGGSNSIRAFLPRTVGPGTFATPDSLFNRTFIDKAGDLKLEGNLEYRFTIISVLKGALFVDAGNIWLTRNNDQYPGGLFNMNTFYKQLAVGTGFGLRLDITFFVLRFDLGMPVRKPYLPEGQQWVFNKIEFRDGNWRRQNLVLNIAIGYPF